MKSQRKITTKATTREEKSSDTALKNIRMGLIKGLSNYTGNHSHINFRMYANGYEMNLSKILFQWNISKISVYSSYEKKGVLIIS